MPTCARGRPTVHILGGRRWVHTPGIAHPRTQSLDLMTQLYPLALTSCQNAPGPGGAGAHWDLLKHLPTCHLSWESPCVNQHLVAALLLVPVCMGILPSRMLSQAYAYITPPHTAVCLGPGAI